MDSLSTCHLGLFLGWQSCYVLLSAFPKLTDIIKAIDDHINKHEAQVNELKHTMIKMNTIITVANLHSYAATTATSKKNVRSSHTTDDEPPSITVSSAMSTDLFNFVRQKLNVILDPYDISAIHDLPPRRDDGETTYA